MKEITPEPLRCSAITCPQIFEDGDDIIIVGTIEENVEHGVGEAVVRVPRKFFANLKK
jgi:hypothetical protein